MSRRAQENLICAGLLVFFGGVIWLCQDFGPRARMIPLPLAVFGIVLTIAQILWQNLRSTDELQMDLIQVSGMPGAVADEKEEPTPKPKRGGPSFRQELEAVGIVALLLALVFVLGVIPAVFLFTGGYFVLTRQYSWRASLLYTTIMTVSIYLMFVVALQMQPYHGLIAPLIERLKT